MDKNFEFDKVENVMRAYFLYYGYYCLRDFYIQVLCLWNRKNERIPYAD